MMRIILSLLFVLLALPAFAQNLPTNDPHWVVVDAIERSIQPGFVALKAKAEALQASTDTLCGEPSPANLEVVRKAFGEVVIAEARIDFLRFGPLTEANRAERLFFWPDRKGIALRQVQQILAEHDETATELGDLQGKSVAVQGLGALEYVLFGTDSDTLSTIESDFRCRYAETIAEALVAVSTELADAWMAPDGIAEHLANPKPEDTDYRTQSEALEELVGAMAFGLEAIRDQKLLPFLGRDGETPKPKSAPFWRSRLTIAALQAAFAGIEDLYRKSHVTAGLAEGNATIGTEANAQFAALGTALAAAAGPVDDLANSSPQQQALEAVSATSSALQTTLGEKLPGALALSTGFSSLDGD